MSKLDLGKTDRAYYSAKPKPTIMEFGPMQFLSITGKGDPSSPAFADKIQALYATAYTLKFACKARSSDFVVAKLEGLWWFDEQKYKDVPMEESPRQIPRSEWMYRLLIRMPDFVGAADVEEARSTAVNKKGVAAAEAVELFEMTEGMVVQMLHTGPFNTEPETLGEMMAFMKQERMLKNGLHHEIYLSDFRKTPPEKLKTILREPVKYG